MKNEIILWLSSVIIVFLVGYIKNVTESNYPITGTFGIEGKKVSYKLDKVCFDKKFYDNVIISDIKGIEARALIINNDEQNEIAYKEIDKGLDCEIPILNPSQKLRYKVIINYNETTYEIPKDDFVTLTFWGNIPSPVSIMYFIFLYSGLVMVLRSLLEVFTKKINLKKFTIITCTLFITVNILVYPLYNTYKLGAINHYVPPFSDLVNPILLMILLLWIIGTILIFNRIFIKTITTVVSLATVLMFFFLN